MSAKAVISMFIDINVGCSFRKKKKKSNYPTLLRCSTSAFGASQTLQDTSDFSLLLLPYNCIHCPHFIPSFLFTPKRWLISVVNEQEYAQGLKIFKWEC